MRTDLTAILNGVDLLNLSESIYVEDINEEPVFALSTETRMPYGVFVLGEPERERLNIRLTVLVKERDRIRRQAVITALKGWAKTGWLKVNTRENQRIYVICTSPASHSVFSRSQSIDMTFTAFNEPYWQDENPIVVTLSGSSGSGSIKPRGTRKCFLEIEATNNSGGTITSFSVTGAGQTITFSGISLPNGGTLRIYYDTTHIFRAEVNGSSIASARTEGSVDDIFLQAMTLQTISFSTSGSCSVKFIARGLYD